MLAAANSSCRQAPRRIRKSLAPVLALTLIAAADRLPGDDGGKILLAANFSSSSPGDGSQPLPSDDQLIDRINELIRRGWQDHGVRPAKAAEANQWVRRLYLDLIGRIPTVDELDELGRLRSKADREELVDRLLSPEYADEFAAHWTNVWTNVLIGRTGGTERRSVTSRDGMRDYVERSLRSKKPYDQMVRELVTAVGDARPDMEEYNGAVNFLIGKMDENGVQAAAKTAQVFLGMSVQCTQCHNHPFNEHRQNQFWELNAFFRQTRVVNRPDPDDNGVRYGSLTDVDFAGEGRSLAYSGDNRSEVYLEMRNGKLVDRDLARVSEAPIYYELRNGQLQVAYPAFVDGSSLADLFEEQENTFGNSGRLEHVNRRQELAKLILAAPELERALVNRLWSHFLGYGFTKPVDDMGSHNLPSHPELLDELSAAFRASGFDLRQLMRWIVLSEPYSLSSRIGKANQDDDPELGRAPLFSHFYTRQMQAEQLYESLLAATQADATVSAGDRDGARQRWLDQFNTAFGNDEATESTTFNGSIPQSLMMINGDLVRRAVSTDRGGFLDTVANDASLSNREKIGYLYRAALGRTPTREETRACNMLLASRGGDVLTTLQDVWWAVLNTNEFILVH